MFGGFVAQEVLKATTKRYKPISQLLCFQDLTSFSVDVTAVIVGFTTSFLLTFF